MTSNITAVPTQIPQNLGDELHKFFSDPIILALLSSGIIITGVGLLLKFVFKLGGANTEFKKAVTDIGELKKGVSAIEDCIIEIQTIMKQKYSKSNLDFTHSINKYGQAHSPISLRAEFKEYITSPKLDEQIKKENGKLIEWLKNKEPRTGLDAQDLIGQFVLTDEVSKYLDLTNYKQNLYNKGKTSEDAVGILSVYLFEVLIPQLDLPDGDKREELKKIKS